MTRVAHVVGADAGDAELLALRTLLERLPSATWSQSVLWLDARRAAASKPVLGRSGVCLPVRTWLPWAAGGSLYRRVRDDDLVHLWGADALKACAAVVPSTRAVVSLGDPSQGLRLARWVRLLPGCPAVVVESRTGMAAAVGHGVPLDRVVLVRGPVDFGRLQAGRAAELRRRLVGDSEHVVLCPRPVVRDQAHPPALWAAAVVAKLHRGLRLIIPEINRETRRLKRLAGVIHLDELVVLADGELAWPDLVAAADVLIVPAVRDVPAAPIAWAMAAGAAVVGVAQRSVTELIADRHNGLLCKTARPRLLASRLLTMLEDVTLRRRLRETARGHAYEVFGVRRFVEQQSLVYENVLSGRPPGDGISDSARVA